MNQPERRTQTGKTSSILIRTLLHHPIPLIIQSVAARIVMVVHNLKCVVIGDSGVGKSSLLTRFVKGEFRGTQGTRSTISAAFLERQVDLGDGVSVKLEIWDTAGQERFRSLNTPMYYRGAAGAILVYDACNEESWRNVPGWYSQLRMMGEAGCCVAMCGSKLDLANEGQKRVVETSAVRQFVDKQNIPVFLETSAKTGENVEDLFLALARAMVQAAANQPTKQANKVKLEMPNTRSSNSSCC